MVHVIAMIELVPGKRDDFLRELQALLPVVRAEPGCLEYTPTADVRTDIAKQKCVGADTVVMIEKWSDVRALKAHLDAPHMHAFRRRVAGWVADTTLHILEPISHA